MKGVLLVGQMHAGAHAWGRVCVCVWRRIAGAAIECGRYAGSGCECMEACGWGEGVMVTRHTCGDIRKGERPARGRGDTMCGCNVPGVRAQG